MLLSRIWFLILTSAAVFSVTAALLTQAAVNRLYDAEVDDQLRRDRFELDLILRNQARVQLDAIAPLAGQPDVRTLLAKLNRPRSETTTGDRQALADKLRGLNNQLEEMQADLLFAVNSTGEVVTQIGGA